MKLHISIYLCDDYGEKFFGEGPYRLLCGIRKEGSLRAAAMSMGMAYTKAAHLLKRAEQQCGFPLTMRRIGGQGGGGSRLTPQAEKLLLEYEKFRRKCELQISEIYEEEMGGFLPLK